MTAAAWALSLLAAAAAVADWNAVARGGTRSIHVFKPAVMVALLGVAIAIQPHSGGQRFLFVVALFCGLAGDLLGWNRFVRPFPGASLWVITTYHAAQVLLVLSLAI